MTQSTTGGPHFVSGASAVQGAQLSAPAASTQAAAVAGSASGPLSSSSSSSSPGQTVAPAVTAFDELLDDSLAKYTRLSQELGGLIAQQVRGHARPASAPLWGATLLTS